ncbi:MAG: nicotinamidase [Treponema sp.]|jgi:nicotinamidase/pyrazinamidase|nr:nicotinamidase [Treponema sp.]
MQLDFSKTALIEVDIQNDFCPAYTGKDGKERPAGSLSVIHGDAVIAPLNELAETLSKKGCKVLASQDWHPANHISFAASHKERKIGDIILLQVSEKAIASFYEKYPDLKNPVPAVIQQILWPVHCVQNTKGAAFHDSLKTEYIDFVFRKGFRKNIDSYSTFFENDRCTPTDLHGYLKKLSVDTLIIGGLATDYCVFYSVMDSLRLGYKTLVLSDAVAGVDLPIGSVNNAIKTMKDAGAVFVSSKDIK